MRRYAMRRYAMPARRGLAAANTTNHTTDQMTKAMGKVVSPAQRASCRGQAKPAASWFALREADVTTRSRTRDT